MCMYCVLSLEKRRSASHIENLPVTGLPHRGAMAPRLGLLHGAEERRQDLSVAGRSGGGKLEPMGRWGTGERG